MSPAPRQAARPPLGLIADIGGTNVRFALATPGGGWTHERVLKVDAFAGPAEAAEAYLADIAPPARPTHGAFCVACPCIGDRIKMTNAAWSFSLEDTRRRLGLASLRVVNDFVANALACPLVGPEHSAPIGGDTTRSGSAISAPVAAIGPGTGLGVALLVPGPGGLTPVGTEGGHVTLAATDDRQAAVLGLLRRDWDHVSAERLVSGPGLALLHGTLRRLDGAAPPAMAPPEITAAALRGDPAAVETLSMFCAFLGSVAGNLALTTGALGGVYILGGIIPDILAFFRDSPFRDAFEAKGRFRDYLAAVPTTVVTHPYPAFLGLEGLCFSEIPVADTDAARIEEG